MEYQPLDVQRNEIRILKILSANPNEIICLTLENVSLDDFTEDSKDYLSTSGKQIYRSQAFWDRARAKYRTAGNLPQRAAAEIEDQNIRAQECRAIANDLLFNSKWQRWTWGDYMAVSYTWGSWDDAQKVMVNGHAISITKNLHEFLWTSRKFLYRTLGCGLWIDAICIDQSNVEERNAQVKRMGSLYEQAFGTMAWLGPGTNDSDKAIRLLEMLIPKNQVRVLDFMRELPLDRLPPGSWFALHSFFERDYWSRLWIIQELAMGDTTMSMMCGDSTIAWGDLANTVDLLATDFSALFARYHQDATAMGIEPAAMAGFIRVQQLGRFYNKYGKEGTRLNFLEILTTARQAQQKDPRDKVYGIMSLISPNISALITPSYTLSTREVYTSLVDAYLRATQSIDVIFQSRSSCLEGDEWPSWLPNFMQPDVVDTEMTRGIPYRASGDTKACANIEKSNLLQVKGFLFDRVDGLGNSFMSHITSHGAPGDKGMESVFEDGMPVVQADTVPDEMPYADLEGLKEALWRTLLTDRDDFGNIANAAFLLKVPIKPAESQQYLRDNRFFLIFSTHRLANQKFEVLGIPFILLFPVMETEFEFPSEHDVLYAIQRAVTLSIGRKLMTTEKGYIGQVPITTQKGDVIAILFGSTVPVILRPSRNGGYKLVGESYIHGIMNGEAMKDFEDGKFTEELFSIY